MKNFIKNFIIFSFVFSWLFFGGPQVWENPSFPPETKKALAAAATYTVNFATTIEGFSYINESCSIGATCTQGYIGTDGNPAGSLYAKVVGRNKKNLGYFKKSLTWENMGVPSGATVTQVDGSFAARLFQETHSATQAAGLKIFNSSDATSVFTGGVDLETEFDPTSASWVTRNTDGAKSVDAAYQASNTTVTIRMRTDVNSGNNNSASTEVRTDTLSFTITYSVPSETSVNATGSQTSGMVIPSANNYVGGKFVIAENSGGSRNVTGITIAEQGTVDALNNINNIKLFYESDTSPPYDCASESYGGSELQFGSTDTNGFSAANGTSSFTGAVGISTTSTMCVYVILDVGSGASNGQTMEIQITNPSTDVTASAGTVEPASAVAISGTTTLSLSVISITISDSAIAYGYVNITADTTGVGGDTQTVTNNGNVAEDFEIVGQNSADWTLGASAGDAIYKHAWCASNCDSSPVWNALTTAYQSLATNIAASGTQDFDLQVTVPTLNAGNNQQNVNITIRASQH